MQFKINENKEDVAIIRKAINDNEGYCPCALEKTDDTKCMCKSFRTEIAEGNWCHCGLYQKIKE